MSSLADVRRANNAQPSSVGRHAVVVGGTSGIGHGVARRLAQAGVSVTIVGRSERNILRELQEVSPPGSNASHSFVPVNGFLLSSVDEAAKKICNTHEKLDYLVQTQGMATTQGFTPSPEEGLDQKLCLHIYSRASFARQLAPLLEKGHDSRFVLLDFIL